MKMKVDVAIVLYCLVAVTICQKNGSEETQLSADGEQSGITTSKSEPKQAAVDASSTRTDTGGAHNETNAEQVLQKPVNDKTAKTNQTSTSTTAVTTHTSISTASVTPSSASVTPSSASVTTANASVTTANASITTINASITTTPEPTTLPTTKVEPTELPTSSSPKPNVTSPTPFSLTSTQSVPIKDRRFDGPSFIGGIVLSLGTMAIGFVAFKFYKARTERNYHTL